MLQDEAQKWTKLKPLCIEAARLSLRIIFIWDLSDFSLSFQEKAYNNGFLIEYL